MCGAGVRTFLSSVVSSNNFQLLMYCVFFAVGTPTPPSVFPLAIYASYQSVAYISKLTNNTRVEAVYNAMHTRMPHAMAAGATTEILPLVFLMFQLKIVPCFLYLRWLQLRFKCEDAVVFRIKSPHTVHWCHDNGTDPH